MDDVLASEPICWLLKKSLNEEQTRQRRAALLSMYQKAAEISIHHGASSAYFEFHELEGLEENFQEASDMETAHMYHFLHEGDTKLDGHRVLLVVYPAVVRTWVWPTPFDEPIICTKAEVVVEDPPKQEDVGVDNQGE